MLALIDLFIIVALLIGNGTLYADRDYPVPANLEAVVEVQLHRESWRTDADCTFSGLMVPYTEEPDAAQAPAASQASGEAIAGYSIVLNQKTCAGQVERIERLGEVPRHAVGFLKQHYITAHDVRELAPEHLPTWYTQVTRRIQRLAAHDRAAQAFVARSQPVAP